MTKVSELILQHVCSKLPKIKNTNSGWYTANCPFCIYRGHSPDKRKRFGIIHKNNEIAMHCFNCALNTKWAPGEFFSKEFKWCLETIGIDASTINTLLLYIKEERKNGIVQIKKHHIPLTENWKEIDFSMFKSIQKELENGNTNPDLLQAAEYAISRGIYELDKIYWTDIQKSQLCKRIVIPCYFKNKIVGYSSRYYSDLIPKGILKYINHLPSNYIFNYDKILYEHEYITVHESAVDAFLLNGVAVFGREVKKEQAALLNNFHKKIIYCFDRDKSGTELIEKIISYGWGVAFPNWDKDIKDPADACLRYGRILTLRTIIDSAVYTPFKIRFNLKMLKL